MTVGRGAERIVEGPARLETYDADGPSGVLERAPDDDLAVGLQGDGLDGLSRAIARLEWPIRHQLRPDFKGK